MFFIKYRIFCSVAFRGGKTRKKNFDPMDCRHITGDDQRLWTQYRR
ncbi:unnamed protein product [Staurois parvus]|uniref:Uncharacterized protein n=1 Tax=Staurois parvus TaxID=386267 RepID=A0ABN9CM90_9NEOB|nr:unnamed protein product [Staurois parvus]